MRLPIRPLLLALLIGFLLPLTAEAQERARKDPRLITQDEISASSATNAFDLVRSVRPGWLRIRGSTTLQTQTANVREPRGGEEKSIVVQEAPQIGVYLDLVRLGNQDSLRDISVQDIAELRFLDPAAALRRFGTGHPHGAILIVRRT